MCEIFFIRKMKEGEASISKEAIREVLEQAIIGAQSNKDGFGVFNESKILLKSPERFSWAAIDKVVNTFEGSNFLVFHERSATSGDVTMENTHPFVFKGNLLVHNGIVYGLNNIEAEKEVDSYKLLKKITETEGDSFKDKMEKSLSDTRGSLSCFLFSNQNNLYYFRDGSNFTFCYIPERKLLLGATNGKRLDQMFNKSELGYFSKPKYQRFYKSPKEEIIYQITKNEIKRIGEIESNVSYSANYGNNFHRAHKKSLAQIKRERKKRKEWKQKKILSRSVKSESEWDKESWREFAGNNGLYSDKIEKGGDEIE